MAISRRVFSTTVWFQQISSKLSQFALRVKAAVHPNSLNLRRASRSNPVNRVPLEPTPPPIPPCRLRSSYPLPVISNSNPHLPQPQHVQIERLQQSSTLLQPERFASAAATVTTSSVLNGGVVVGNSGQSADPSGNELLGSALSPHENVVCGALSEMRETRARNLASQINMQIDGQMIAPQLSVHELAPCPVYTQTNPFLPSYAPLPMNQNTCGAIDPTRTSRCASVYPRSVPHARSPTPDYPVENTPPIIPRVGFPEAGVSRPTTVGSSLNPRVQSNLVDRQSEMSDIAVDDSFSSCSETELVEIEGRRKQWVSNWLKRRQQIGRAGRNQRMHKTGQNRRHSSRQQSHHYSFHGHSNTDNQCPPPSFPISYRPSLPPTLTQGCHGHSTRNEPPSEQMAPPALHVAPGSFPCVDLLPPNLHGIVQPSVAPVVNYISVAGPSSSSCKLPPIEKYTDYTSSGQFSDWYYEKFLPMEDQTDSRFVDELSKRRVKGALQTYLDGVALQIFLNIDPGVRTLEAVEAALIGAFDQNEKLRLNEMFSMMQSRKETVAVWEAKIKTHARKSDPKRYSSNDPFIENQCAEAFEGGLLTKYKTDNVLESESFKDKVYWAKYEEANERQRRQSNVKAPNVDHCSQQNRGPKHQHSSGQNQQAGVSYCANNATAPLVQTVGLFGPSTSSSGLSAGDQANFGGNHGNVHPVKFSNGVPLPRSLQLDPYWQHGGYLWTFPPNGHERGVASLGNGRTCFRCGADNHIRSDCRSWAINPCTGLPYSDFIQNKIRPWIPKSVYRWDSSGSDISQRGYSPSPT